MIIWLGFTEMKFCTVLPGSQQCYKLFINYILRLHVKCLSWQYGIPLLYCRNEIFPRNRLSPPSVWKSYSLRISIPIDQRYFYYVFGPASARSYKIGVVASNWLVVWLVGNVVFSETALRIFLIFCMKLGTIKVEKWHSRIFKNKFLIWRFSRKGLQISPKLDTLKFGWLVGW